MPAALLEPEQRQHLLVASDLQTQVYTRDPRCTGLGFMIGCGTQRPWTTAAHLGRDGGVGHEAGQADERDHVAEADGDLEELGVVHYHLARLQAA